MRKEQRSVPIRLVQMLSRMAVLCSDPVFPRVFPRLVLRISPTLIKQRNSKYYIRHIEEIGNSTRIFQLGFPLVFFFVFDREIAQALAVLQVTIILGRFCIKIELYDAIAL